MLNHLEVPPEHRNTVVVSVVFRVLGDETVKEAWRAALDEEKQCALKEGLPDVVNIRKEWNQPHFMRSYVSHVVDQSRASFLIENLTRVYVLFKPEFWIPEKGVFEMNDLHMEYCYRNGISEEQQAYERSHMQISDILWQGSRLARSVGCPHYIRGCEPQCHNCGEFVPCRFCHDDPSSAIHPYIKIPDEAEYEGPSLHSGPLLVAPPLGELTPSTDREPPLVPSWYPHQEEVVDELMVCEPPDHSFPRFDTTAVKCLYCGHVGPVTKSCEACGREFASYFCARCKIFCGQGEESKPNEHCDACGYCRVTAKGRTRHCAKCGRCYSSYSFDSHNCVRSMGNCIFCLDELDSGILPVIDIPCGLHYSHAHCYELFLKNNFDRTMRCPICRRLAIFDDQLYDYTRRWLASAKLHPRSLLQRSLIVPCSCLQCGQRFLSMAHVCYRCPNPDCLSFNIDDEVDGGAVALSSLGYVLCMRQIAWQQLQLERAGIQPIPPPPMAPLAQLIDHFVTLNKNMLEEFLPTIRHYDPHSPFDRIAQLNSPNITLTDLCRIILLVFRSAEFSAPRLQQIPDSNICMFCDTSLLYMSLHAIYNYTINFDTNDGAFYKEPQAFGDKETQAQLESETWRCMHFAANSPIRPDVLRPGRAHGSLRMEDLSVEERDRIASESKRSARALELARRFPEENSELPRALPQSEDQELMDFWMSYPGLPPFRACDLRTPILPAIFKGTGGIEPIPSHPNTPTETSTDEASKDEASTDEPTNESSTGSDEHSSPHIAEPSDSDSAKLAEPGEVTSESAVPEIQDCNDTFGPQFLHILSATLSRLLSSMPTASSAPDDDGENEQLSNRFIKDIFSEAVKPTVDELSDVVSAGVRWGWKNTEIRIDPWKIVLF